jgi:hypothetical protein
MIEIKFELRTFTLMGNEKLNHLIDFLTGLWHVSLMHFVGEINM